MKGPFKFIRNNEDGECLYEGRFQLPDGGEAVGNHGKCVDVVVLRRRIKDGQ